MLADPGVIQRTPETCFPIPAQVMEMLLRGERAEENVTDGTRSFCVRCFVWRTEKASIHSTGLLNQLLKIARPTRAHHCSICQRCVLNFDHHCSVFGRCITSGNLCFFYGLIALGTTGGLTFTLSLVLSLSLSWDFVREKPLIYISICLLLFLYCCRGPLRWLCCAAVTQCRAVLCKHRRSRESAESGDGSGSVQASLQTANTAVI
eukprot:Skav231547  [mRNA]  locus=scaffold84:783049:783666:- [translate_table: standard]